MSNLSAKTRALIERGRDADEPSQEDLARVRRALAIRLGATALVGAAATTVTSRAAAGISSLFGATKSMTVVVSFVAGGAIAGGAMAVRHTFGPQTSDARAVSSARAQKVEARSTSARQSRAEIPSEDNAPPVSARVESAPLGQIFEPKVGSALQPVGDVDRGVAPGAPTTIALGSGGHAIQARSAHSNAHSAARQTKSSGRPALAFPVSTQRSLEPTRTNDHGPNLARELELLHAAQEALHGDRGLEALDLLDRHARQFPGGTLSEEREASRVLVLCQLGRTAQAQAAAHRFAWERPASPFIGRVREACSRAK